MTEVHHNGKLLGWSLRDLVLLAATATVFYLCWVLARPFLAPITWAFALAVVGRPVHVRLMRKLPSGLASILTVLLVIVVLLVPASFLIQRVAREALDLASWIHSEMQSGKWAGGHFPWVDSAAQWLGVRIDLAAYLNQVAGTIAAWAPSLVSRSAWVITQVVIMLFTLFFFFRDREKLLEMVRGLVPLPDRDTQTIFDRISDTIYASLYGNVVVKLVQGLLGGFMFWILGLPAAALWGAAMSLAAVFPFVGTAFVWGPAALLLLRQGHPGKALILAAWGLLIISVIDNVLYPMLIGIGLHLHTLGVFFAILGGLAAFGISGFILGPGILALANALTEIWRRRLVSG